MNSFVRAYKDLTVPRMIINIGSGAGRHPVESWSTYCASKSALDMISEVFRTEQNLLPFENQIRIHSLAPGIVDTRMQEEIRAVDSADFSDKERFVMYKEKNQLSSAERVCRYIADIMENPDKYGETLLDVRKINL
jgi:benzil reductase ((S)-benzoin forming)